MAKKKRDTKTTKRAHKGAAKARYRVSNWAAYNASLVQRGSITVWISGDSLVRLKDITGFVPIDVARLRLLSRRRMVRGRQVASRAAADFWAD
jgi:hypothetical protein